MLLEEDNLNFSFPKHERITSKIKIALLFQKKSCVVVYPFKALYLIEDKKNTPHNQVAISVPKRFFKKAPDRNAIKRHFKESYRQQNKSILTHFGKDKEKSVSIFFIYIGKKIESHQFIWNKTGDILRKINGIIDELPK